MRHGDFTRAAVYLLGLLALAIVTLVVAGRMVNLFYIGAGPVFRKRTRAGAAPYGLPSPSPGRPRHRLAQPPASSGRSAMVDKDSRLLLREPFFRMVLLQSVYFLVIAVVMLLGPRAQAAPGWKGFTSGMAWFASVFSTLAQSAALYNLFGWKGTRSHALPLSRPGSSPAPGKELDLLRRLRRG